MELTADTKTTVSGYQLDQMLSSTAFSNSYIATDSNSQEKVLFIIYNQVASDNVVQQAKQLAAKACEHILPIYDCGSANGKLYVSCQYLPNASLKAKVEQGIDAGTASALSSQLLQALADLHTHSIYHGNLNPDNIHFDQSGQLYFSHFAFTDSEHRSLSPVGDQVDQASFCAPERFSFKAPSAQSDIYSSALLTYFIHSAKQPFALNSDYERAMAQLKTPLSQLEGFKDLSTDVQQAIQQAGQKSSKRRPNSAAQALSILKGNTSNASQAVAMDDNFSFSADSSDRATMKKLEKTSKKREEKNSHRGHNTVIVLLLILISLGTAVALAPIHSSLAIFQPLHQQIVDFLDPSAEQIKRLSARGQQQINNQEYLEAAKTYHAILAIKNNYPLAIERLNWLVDNFLSQAYTALEQDDLVSVEIQINNALEVGANSAAVREVQAAYQAKLQARMDAEKALQAEQAAALEAELAAAEAARLAAEQAEQARLSAAAEAKRLAAEKAEQERLAAEAEARRLAAEKAEQERLAQEQAAKEAAALLAKQKAQQEALAKAAALQAELERRNQLLAQVKVTGLLKKAETFYARGEYRAPAKDNALEKYQEVLALSPNNEVAKAGLDKTVKAIMPELIELFNKEQYSQGKSLYNQLIQAAPDNQDLKLFGAAQGL